MDFEKKCYQLVFIIPSRKVCTYKEIARALKSKAYQIVENVMAKNKNYSAKDIEILEDQKNYYETSVSYSTLSLEIREGSGISLFSWNYYVQRALGWIEELVGITISLSIVLVPLGILIIGYRRFKNKK